MNKKKWKTKFATHDSRRWLKHHDAGYGGLHAVCPLTRECVEIAEAYPKLEQRWNKELELIHHKGLQSHAVERALIALSEAPRHQAKGCVDRAVERCKRLHKGHTALKFLHLTIWAKDGQAMTTKMAADACKLTVGKARKLRDAFYSLVADEIAAAKVEGRYIPRGG